MKSLQEGYHHYGLAVKCVNEIHAGIDFCLAVVPSCFRFPVRIRWLGLHEGRHGSWG